MLTLLDDEIQEWMGEKGLRSSQYQFSENLSQSTNLVHPFNLRAKKAHIMGSYKIKSLPSILLQSPPFIRIPNSASGSPIHSQNLPQNNDAKLV